MLLNKYEVKFERLLQMMAYFQLFFFFTKHKYTEKLSLKACNPNRNVIQVGQIPSLF